MKIKAEVSESIVENLLIEIEMINSRISKLLLNYNQTSNLELKKRLYREHRDLSNRLCEINSISNVICTLSTKEISLSNLLLVQSNKSLK